MLLQVTTAFAWSWHEAYQTLMADNIAVFEAQQRVQSAFWEFQNERSYHFPALDLRAGSERFLKEDATLGYRTFVGPRLTWNLFQGGNVHRRRKLFQLRSVNARRQLTITELDQVEALRKAFAQGIYSKHHLTLVQSFVDRGQTNERIVALRYKSGHEERWVHLSAQASIRSDQLRVQRAEQEQQSALYELRRLLGKLPIDHVKDIDEVDFFDVALVISQDWPQQLDQHPRILQAQNDVQDARLQMDLAEGRRLPTLGMRTDFMMIDTDSQPIIPFWYAGANFSLPLLEGGRIKRSVAIAKQDLINRQRQLTQLRQDMQQDIESRIVEYQISINQLEVRQLELAAAKDRAHVADKRYQMGLTSYDDWDRSQGNLRNREIDALRGQRDAHYRQAELEKALGLLP